MGILCIDFPAYSICYVHTNYNNYNVRQNFGRLYPAPQIESIWLGRE